ncbi:MAG: hypothetical protein JW937_01780 [Candidatus Omnitrophica bacterium]|nr:hypothetical protein [Candidatus Omnitrophota bacterium]
MDRILSFIFILLIGSALSSCATLPKKPVFKDLAFGMSEGAVEDMLGAPKAVQGKDYGTAEIEVWEYTVTDNKGKNPETFWVVFQDGRLSQWGRPETLETQAPIVSFHKTKE